MIMKHPRGIAEKHLKDVFVCFWSKFTCHFCFYCVGLMSAAGELFQQCCRKCQGLWACHKVLHDETVVLSSLYRDFNQTEVQQRHSCLKPSPHPSVGCHIQHVYVSWILCHIELSRTELGSAATFCQSSQIKPYLCCLLLKVQLERHQVCMIALLHKYTSGQMYQQGL